MNKDKAEVYYKLWKKLHDKYRREGDINKASICFGQEARLSALYINPKPWRVIYYDDFKPFFW